MVTAAEDGRPIAGASIYVNNSTLGSPANEKGFFRFTGAGINRVDLVVSAIGYQTRIINKSFADTSFLNIQLKRKEDELQQVVVSNYLKDGWALYGQFFFMHFIGISHDAPTPKLKNKEALRFFYNNENRRLRVIAKEPLVIINQHLGFEVTYSLEEWEYDFNTDRLLYTGYPFFKELKGKPKDIATWTENRKKAYYGSLMHFLRSVYRNKVHKEGFIVHASTLIPNTEKERVKKIMDAHKGDVQAFLTYPLKDSLSYYGDVMRQRNMLHQLDTGLLPADSFAVALDLTTAGLQFYNHISIHYQFSKTEKNKHNAIYTSYLTLIGKEIIPVYSDGSYDFSESLLLEGSWALRGKILFLLPVSYQPGTD